MQKALAAPARSRVPVERAVRLGLVVVPLLFAVPILLGLTRSIIDLLGESHPYFGDISGSATDANALRLGSPIYQDPAVGYTPLVYTPLMSLLSAGLEQLKVWDGWTLMLTLLGDIGLIALAARLAWGAGGETGIERALALAGAVGVGALAFWLMAFVPFNFAFAPRPDQLSWCFALLGLALLPAAADGSRRAQVGTVVLLSAGFWTKQTAAPAVAAAVVWLGLEVARGRVRPRTAASLAIALAGVNALLFGALNLLTDGWAWHFIVELPSRRASLVSTPRSIADLFESVGVSLAAAGVAWAAAMLARRQGAEWPARTTAVARVLLVFIVIDAPMAVWFRETQGAVHNMYVGVGWACGLLLAVAWGSPASGSLR